MAYLDGVYLAASEARISPFDRGFLFADAVYEVTAVFNGVPVDMEGHLARLQRSLEKLGFTAAVDLDEIAVMHNQLIRINALEEGLIYLQVSRGAYGERDFPPPKAQRATVFAYASAKKLIETNSAREGIKAIFIDDTRWGRRDIKTTQLLSQALAKEAAISAGAQDAWMVEDGLVTEAASANAWIVSADNVLVTRHISNQILAGITRSRVFEEVGKDMKIEERAFSPDEAKAAKEAFSTSASALVMPVVQLGGHVIGNGKPGPVTRAVQRAYYAQMGADLQTVAPWAV